MPFRIKAVLLSGLLLAVAACETVTPRLALEPSSELPLVQLPRDRDQADLVLDRAACRQAGGDARACQVRQGYRPLTVAEGHAFRSAIEGDGETKRLSVLMHRIDDGAIFAGFTELFPRGRTSPIILDGARGHRCDGVGRLVRLETLDFAPVGDALLGCSDGAVLSLRIAIDTPTSGHGVGWDDRGRRYSLLLDTDPVPTVTPRLARALRMATDSGSPLIGVRPDQRDERFSLRQVRSQVASVPRLYGTSLAEPVGRRKTAFLRRLLPVVMATNELIRAERTHMITLLERRAIGEALSPTNEAWLKRLATRYDANWRDNPTLRYRVDVVPPSLALAQAALETGWGQSRFVLQGNALFGEWTFGDRRGLVPDGRAAGETHKIRSFDTLMQSVVSYMDNLNTNQAYRTLRAKRAQARAIGHRATGYDLAQYLEHYAGDSAYISKLQRIIRVNALTAYDDAALSPASIGPIAQPLPKPSETIQVASGGGSVLDFGFGNLLRGFFNDADRH